MKKFFLAFSGLVLFVVLALYLNGQRQQSQLEDQWLNSDFSKIQPQQGGVLFAPSNFGIPLQINKTPFVKPMILFTGSPFERGDEHFFIHYTLEQIGEDGVVISYQSEGGSPAQVGNASGKVKLVWK